jgi:hypothetical protein
MVAEYLRRGLLAWLLAGLLAGAFAFAFGEPTVDGAIRYEEASAAAAAAGRHSHGGEGGHSHGGEEEVLVGRPMQKAGLFFATGIFGTTMGGLFGIAYSYFRGRLSRESEWGRSLSLAGAVFLGAILVPFVKYPANPPTVGDPATIGARTAQYFSMEALSLLVVLGAWWAARRLKERGMGGPARQLSVVAGSLVAFGLLFLAFPPTSPTGEFPSGLLWDFRVSSLGTQVVFWGCLGAIFGLLGERAARGRLA